MKGLLRAALLLVGIGFLVLSVAGPAEAQEWKIYLLGKIEPIVADYYVEDTPWVFFHDDQSMYLFAVGCNRIDRVERAGAGLPKPACPIDRLPTTMPRIYIQIIDLEGKRLDDSIAKLREQTRAYAEAVFGSVAATRQTGATASAQAQAQIELTRALGAISFLQSQINDTLLDIRLSEARVGALLDATKAFPQGSPQRYYFFAR
jgi:hypothetical protein